MWPALLLRTQLSRCPCVRRQGPLLLPLRAVHAQWRVLLNHEWIRQHTPTGPATIGAHPTKQHSTLLIPLAEDPSYDVSSSGRTVLCLHGPAGNLLDCRKTALDIVNQAAAQNLSGWQCLLVDLRGHGESDIDEYTTPHSLEAVCDDVMECILCYGLPPNVVVATGGSLSYAIALKYLEKTVTGEGAPASLSYEVSGDSIRIPDSTLLMNCPDSFSRDSFPALLTNIAFTMKKTGSILKDPEFALLKDRATLRKRLLDGIGTKQRTGTRDLLESLKLNMDLLSEKNEQLFQELKLRDEKDVELLDLNSTGQMLEAIASECERDASLYGKLQEFVESNAEGVQVCLTSSSQPPRLYGKGDANENLKLVLRATK